MVAVLTALVWRLRRGTVRERRFLRWAALTLAWCWLALGLTVPSLATVVKELPVDHYHAFLDPIVVGGLAVIGLSFVPGWIEHLRVVLGEGPRNYSTPLTAWQLEAIPVVAAAVVAEERRSPGALA